MSKIEWTDKTWNPIIGCNKVSQGCDNCYAETIANRLSRIETTRHYRNVVSNGMWNGVTTFVQSQLTKPADWKKPCKIFVCSMGDLFHESIPFSWIDAVFSIMSDNDRHIYQVLTKRPLRVIQFYDWKRNEFGVEWRPKDNVWLGVSVENRDQIKRIDYLFYVYAKVRFISAEPLLGYLNISDYLKSRDPEWRLNWVIAGGESGRKARPVHPEWIRSLRDQCSYYNTPFFFKQWGEWHTDWINMQTKEPVFRMYIDHEQWTRKNWVKKGDSCISLDGKLCKNGLDMKEAKYPVAIMQKVGKSKSGRLLDCKEYKQFPDIDF